MGTKIYDAFYSLRPMEDIMQVLRTRRYRYTSAVYSLVVNEMVEMALKEYDKQSFLGKSFDSFMVDSFNKLYDNFEKNIFVLNTELTVYLYPFDSKVYILLCGSNDLKQLFINEESDTLGLCDYQYWNNSDRPEHISSKEWNDRDDFWSSAFSMTRFHDYKDNFLSYKYNENITDIFPYEHVIRDCDKTLIKPLRSDLNRKKYLYMVNYEKRMKIAKPSFSTMDYMGFIDEVQEGIHDDEINKYKLNDIGYSEVLKTIGIYNEK